MKMKYYLLLTIFTFIFAKLHRKNATQGGMYYTKKAEGKIIPVKTLSETNRVVDSDRRKYTELILFIEPEYTFLLNFYILYIDQCNNNFYRGHVVEKIPNIISDNSKSKFSDMICDILVIECLSLDDLKKGNIRIYEFLNRNFNSNDLRLSTGKKLGFDKEEVFLHVINKNDKTFENDYAKKRRDFIIDFINFNSHPAQENAKSNPSDGFFSGLFDFASTPKQKQFDKNHIFVLEGILLTSNNILLVRQGAKLHDKLKNLLNRCVEFFEDENSDEEKIKLKKEYNEKEKRHKEFISTTLKDFFNSIDKTISRDNGFLKKTFYGINELSYIDKSPEIKSVLDKLGKYVEMILEEYNGKNFLADKFFHGDMKNLFVNYYSYMLWDTERDLNINQHKIQEFLKNLFGDCLERSPSQQNFISKETTESFVDFINLSIRQQYANATSPELEQSTMSFEQFISYFEYHAKIFKTTVNETVEDVSQVLAELDKDGKLLL
jgi:hypothetical protein